MKILWVDDEVELLKPHILFLEERGYRVVSCNNGYDAVEMVQGEDFDLVILDEMMPGMTGLETLPLIKAARPMLPVVMVTKSEEERIMDQAVGKKIADYLIKPVNPHQVLLSIKKILHHRRLISEQAVADYRAGFAAISQALAQARTHDDWVDIYRQLVAWEIELSEASDEGLCEILASQKAEAQAQYAKFVRANYLDWINHRDERTPIMSHTLIRSKVLPLLDENQKTTLLLIDNFRYDQWRAVSDLLTEDWSFSEDFYCSILPTATQYARNAVFAGLMPLAIDKIMPEKWLNDNEEGGKNKYEEEFLRRQMASYPRELKITFDKLVRPEAGRRLLDNISRIYEADLSVIVYNFLDILSHARTEDEIIREMTRDEAAFRSLTRSWFEHSELLAILRLLARRGHQVIITTDHGTVRVENPIKIFGDRETSPNLRYKTGRNLNHEGGREVFEIHHPEQAQLPSSHLTSSYVFASKSDFFVYPTNTNQFVRYYKETFQHGGISLEEMIVPFIVLKPKG